MFFDTWEGIGRTILVGLLSYVALVAILRVSGKRTLTKMNAFDFVVTVALGSTLATILLNQDVALVEGAAALVLLVALQFAVARVSAAWPGFQRAVKSEPRLLAYRSQLVEDALHAERLAANEVLQAVRQAGIGDLDEVEAVVLETDGSISVIPRLSGQRRALRDVRGWPRDEGASG